MDPDNEFEEDTYAWLSPENVEDRSEADLSGLPEMVASGHSVGGVVYSYVGTDKVYRSVWAARDGCQWSQCGGRGLQLCGHWQGI